MINKQAVVVIGAGIVGLATALALTEKGIGPVVILEAEDTIAAHQTGNNSGVIHSGLYYKPGSLKAKNCIEGRKLLFRFCEQHLIPHQRCGKLVVATKEEEIPYLERLAQRGREHKLQVKNVPSEEIERYEPHVRALQALWVPETGIVDYKAVAHTYAKLIRGNGGEIKLGHQVLDIQTEKSDFIIRTTQGEIQARFLVNCAGLFADRIARMAGLHPPVQIIPFRGEYYQLHEHKRDLVNNLIYPVPNPNFPFLGVHFTRMIGGGVEAGPNAVLAFKRTGYSKMDVDIKDLLEILQYSGFRKLARKNWRMGLQEMLRSISKRAFLTSLQNMIPELELEDIQAGGAGVRAQALSKNGELVDDFYILEGKGMVHVLNAPSPAATASLAIGQTIANMVKL